MCETIELLQGETNELETSGEPDTTSQTGRQMNCGKGKQMESRTPPARLGDKWIAVGETNQLETCGEPDTTSQTGRQMNCYKGRSETSGEPDTTSKTGRQMNCGKGKQMNWRHAESQTPPVTMGDRWIAIREDKWIGDIQRAGHHQPDWETNELL